MPRVFPVRNACKGENARGHPPGALRVHFWQDLAERNPQGALIVGAHPLAQEVAETLEVNGYRTVLIDSDGKSVVSGIYIYKIESPSGNKLGRFIIVR